METDDNKAWYLQRYDFTPSVHRKNQLITCH